MKRLSLRTPYWFLSISQQAQANINPTSTPYSSGQQKNTRQLANLVFIQFSLIVTKAFDAVCNIDYNHLPDMLYRLIAEQQVQFGDIPTGNDEPTNYE